MRNMNKILGTLFAGLFTLAALSSPVNAQGTPMSAGYLWANCTAQTLPARSCSPASLGLASAQIRLVRTAANTWVLYDQNNAIVNTSASNSQGYQEFLNLVASSGYGGTIQGGEQIASGDTGVINTTVPIVWPPLQGVSLNSGWYTLNCTSAVTGVCETYDTLVQVDINLPHQVVYAGTAFPVLFNPVNNAPLDGIPGILNSTIRIGPTAPATGASYTGGVRMTPTNNIIGSSIRLDQIACLGPPASPCSASEGFQLDNPGGIIQVRNNTISGVINQANAKGVRIGTSSTGMTAVFDNTIDFHVAMPAGSLSSTYCMETWAVNNRYTGSCYSDGSGLLLGSSSNNQDFTGFINTATTRLTDNSTTHNNPGAYGPSYPNRTIAFSASRTLTQADSFGVLDSGGASGTVVATLTAANYGTGFTTCALTTGGHAITYTASSGSIIYPGGSGASITVAVNETACLRFDGTNYELTDASPALQFTLGFGGTVAVGGTGQSSLTNHGLIVGAGSSAVSVTAVGATGQYLRGNTGVDPTWATLNCAALADAGTGCASSSGITALTGDVTATGPGSVAATLATVNSNVGSFGSSTAIPSFTVNGKGLITAASTNVVIAPAGTLTGTTLASNVVASSLTSVGTLTSLTIGAGSAITSSGAGGTAAVLTVANAGNLIFTDATYDIGASGATRPRNYFGSGGITIGGTVLAPFLQLSGGGSSRTFMSSGSDGNLALFNSGASGFGRLQFGGTTSLFSAIKSSGTTVAIRLADDSADAALTASTITGTGAITSTGSSRQISVGAATGEKLASNAGFDAEGFGSAQNAGVERLAGAYNTSTHQGQLGAFGASTSTSLALMTANAGVPANGVVIDSSQNTTFLGQILVTAMTQTSTAQSGAVCYNSGTGAITYDATLGCLTSSERYKDVIAGIDPDYALSVVNHLAPVFFTFKPEYNNGRDGEFFGLVAEQVATIDERLISRGEDGKPRGVRYADGVTSMNVAAIQAIDAKVKKIEADNDNLRACNDNWKCRLFGMK